LKPFIALTTVSALPCRTVIKIVDKNYICINMICRCGVIRSRSSATDVNKVRTTSKEADFHHYSTVSARVNTAKQRVFALRVAIWTFSMEDEVLITFKNGLYYVRTTLLPYPTACPPRRIIISCSRLAAVFTANGARLRAVRPIRFRQRLSTASSLLHRNGRY